MFRVEQAMIRVFNHYVPRGAFVIAGLETLILALSMYLVIQFWPWQESAGDASGLSFMVAELSVGMLAIMMVMGLYTQESVSGWKGAFHRLVAAFLLGGMVLGVLVAAGRHAHLIVYPIGVGAGLALMVISLERIVVARFQGAGGALPNRILVLGSGSWAAQVDNLVGRGPEAPVRRVVGYLPVNENQSHVPGDRVLRRQQGESLLALVTRHRVREIIVAVRDRRQSMLPMSELLECKLRGVRVTDLSSFFEREGGRVSLESLNPSWLVFGDGFRSSRIRTIAKRLFDLCASLALIVLTLPVILATALLIRLTMGGPVLYWQQRVGRHGAPFYICKFRSMRNDAESDGRPRWADQNDSRITPLGRLIRKLRIDELPQVYNVLRGDMSFVGPRPERPEFVHELTDKIPFYMARHSVKPGITGWAQVRYPYGASLEDARRKLQYDLYYVKNRGLFLDCIILLMTVEVVLWSRGAR